MDCVLSSHLVQSGVGSLANTEARGNLPSLPNAILESSDGLLPVRENHRFPMPIPITSVRQGGAGGAAAPPVRILEASWGPFIDARLLGRRDLVDRLHVCIVKQRVHLLILLALFQFLEGSELCAVCLAFKQLHEQGI